MVKLGVVAFVILAALGAAAWGQESVETEDTTNLVYLTKATCGVEGNGEDSTIAYRLSFGNQKAPQYYYEINRKEKTIVITMGYARCKGARVSDAFGKTTMGPVKSIRIKEDLYNKNQDMPSLLPIWYNVMVTTINCDPIIKDRAMSTAIRDNGSDIIIEFKWPGKKNERRKLYDISRRGFTIMVTSAAAVCVAGLAYGAYYYYKNVYKKTKKDDILEPVLPDHPSGK